MGKVYPECHSYCTFNTREGKLASFDLESEEITIRVLKAGDDCTVMDDSNSRFYMVKTDEAEKAVKAYIDWCYGMVKVWAPDPDEFGCYEPTTREVWASECCAIYEQREPKTWKNHGEFFDMVRGVLSNGRCVGSTG